MNTSGYTRKLTTIFSADVAGYSRLMGEDEAVTVKTLTSYRKILTELIRQHHGRVIDSPGDNLLAEFASVVDAVQCAVSIQKEIQSRNDELPEARRMNFRIGINLGDVIEEDGRIYGAGVNVAARLEALADPGGIFISKTAFEYIESKLPLSYEYLGEQKVKNITKPIGAYRVLMEPKVTAAKRKKTPLFVRQSKRMLTGAAVLVLIVLGGFIWSDYLREPSIAPVPEAETAQPLSDKPSIAVLPFRNMSEDPSQEYFSDGIAEDIITDLSKISGLIVIARNTSFTYKGKSVNAQQIGRELRVSYLLEGSIRKAGDTVRINAQLIDALNGHHLWADRYDGRMDDVFVLQDKITSKIISALSLKLTANEKDAVADRGTDNLQAYDYFLRGWQGYRRRTKEGFAEAKINLEKAIEIDPEYSRAYTVLSAMYWEAVKFAEPKLRQGLGLTNSSDLRAVKAKPHLLLKKAMQKPTALAHGLMSQLYLMRYQHDEALSEIEQALAMDPNDPQFYVWMCELLWLMGKDKEAMEAAKTGLRLDPNNPAIYLRQLGKSYLPDGNLDEGLQALERALRLNPELSGSILLAKSIILSIQGKNEDARAAYDTFVKSRMSPVRSLNDILLYFQFTDRRRLAIISEALIKAGAPGKTTDYYKIFKENRINGKAVESLLFGQKITGIAMSTGKKVWWEWDKNGNFKLDLQVVQDTGKSWVEKDVCFIQFDKLYGGLPYGTIIYRNPEGSVEGQYQYFMVSDIGSITPFNLTE